MIENRIIDAMNYIDEDLLEEVLSDKTESETAVYTGHRRSRRLKIAAVIAVNGRLNDAEPLNVKPRYLDLSHFNSPILLNSVPKRPAMQASAQSRTPLILIYPDGC